MSDDNWMLDIIPTTSSSDKSHNFLSQPISEQIRANLFNGWLSDIHHPPEHRIVDQMSLQNNEQLPCH